MTIVEKIKALMAKAASTDNEHEAEVFLAKAHELMEKHQLEAHDLDSDDPVGEENTHFKRGSAAPDWDHNLLFGVAAYFGCYAIEEKVYEGSKWIGNHVILIGRESARVTAKEMHIYLVKTVRRLGREKKGEFKIYKEDIYGDKRWTGEYMNADQTARRIGNALRDRLHALARQNTPPEQPKTQIAKNALVTVDRIQTWLTEHHPNMSTIKGRYSHSGSAVAIAEGIGLNLQTGGNSGTKLLGDK